MPQTLLEWVKRSEIDAGTRAGTTTAEAQRLKEPKCEVKELRRADEILKLASAYSAPAEPSAARSLEGVCRDGLA